MKFLWSLLIGLVCSLRQKQRPFLSDCSNYQGMDSCQSGDQIGYGPEAEARRWQTPPKGHALYADANWQSYGQLQGYAHIQYDNAAHTEATVEVRCWTKENQAELLYQFGRDGPWQSGNSLKISATTFADENGLEVKVKFAKDDQVQLKLEPVRFGFRMLLNPWSLIFRFISNGSALKSLPLTPNKDKSGFMCKTNLLKSSMIRGAIVELFGWPYVDVAEECAFLGKAGYLGVKIPPQQEHLMSDAYLQRGELNPWYFTYQPVSYR